MSCEYCDEIALFKCYCTRSFLCEIHLATHIKSSRIRHSVMSIELALGDSGETRAPVEVDDAAKCDEKSKKYSGKVEAMSLDQRIDYYGDMLVGYIPGIQYHYDCCESLILTNDGKYLFYCT